MTLNDINQAKQMVAATELLLAYAIAETVETIVKNGGTVLDISNVYVLNATMGDFKVGRTILYHEEEAEGSTKTEATPATV